MRVALLSAYWYEALPFSLKGMMADMKVMFTPTGKGREYIVESHGRKLLRSKPLVPTVGKPKAAILYYDIEDASSDQLLKIRSAMTADLSKRRICEWLCPLYTTQSELGASTSSEQVKLIDEADKLAISAHPVLKHVMSTALLGNSSGMNKLEGDSWRFAIF